MLPKISTTALSQTLMARYYSMPLPSPTIASMIMSDVNLKSYSDTSYHNEELKSLTRYHFDKVKERASLKSSVSRLVCILFPELEKLVPTLHMVSVYALLSEFPSASAIASAHLTRLTNLLSESSKGRYGKAWFQIPPICFLQCNQVCLSLG